MVIFIKISHKNKNNACSSNTTPKHHTITSQNHLLISFENFQLKSSLDFSTQLTSQPLLKSLSKNPSNLFPKNLQTSSKSTASGCETPKIRSIGSRSARPADCIARELHFSLLAAARSVHCAPSND